MAILEFFDNISYTIYIRVLKLGQKVVYEVTFKMMCHMVTLTKGQGHKMNLRCENWHFLTVFELEYLWHYLYQSCELWSKGSLLHYLQNDMASDDLD